MAVQKITTATEGVKTGFEVVNNNADEVIVSVAYNAGTLTLTKNGGGVISATIPVSDDDGYITVVNGQITQHLVNGEYNKFDITPVSYFYNGSSFSISTTSTVTLATNSSGNPRLDAIVIDTATNSIIKKDGTASASPELPTVDSDEILLGVILAKNGALSTTQSNYILTYSFFEKQLAKLFSEGALKVNSLNDLTDTVISSPLDSQLLIFDSNTSKWKNQTVNFVDKTSNNTSYLKSSSSDITTASNSIITETSYSNIFTTNSYVANPVFSVISSNNSIIVNPTNSTIAGNNNLVMGGNAVNFSGNNIIYAANNGQVVDQNNTAYLEHIRMVGGLQHSNTRVVTDLSLLSISDYTIIADNSEMETLIYLPASPVNGQTYIIKAKENNSNLVSINANGNEFENSEETFIINSGSTSGEGIKQGGVLIQYNLESSKWFILSEYKIDTSAEATTAEAYNGIQYSDSSGYGLGGEISKKTNIKIASNLNSSFSITDSYYHDIFNPNFGTTGLYFDHTNHFQNVELTGNNSASNTHKRGLAVFQGSTFIGEIHPEYRNSGVSYANKLRNGFFLDSTLGQHSYIYNNVESINLGTKVAYGFDDDVKTNSLDWGNRLLYGLGNVVSLDWENRTLKDYTGSVTSIDWNFRTLKDDAGNESVDWTSRILKDNSSTASIDWKNRRLKDNAGNTVLDYSNNISFTKADAAFLNYTLNSNGHIFECYDGDNNQSSYIQFRKDGFDFYAERTSGVWGNLFFGSKIISGTPTEGIYIEGDSPISIESFTAAVNIHADTSIKIQTVSANATEIIVNANDGSLMLESSGGGVTLQDLSGGGVYIKDADGGGIYLQNDMTTGDGTYLNNYSGAGIFLSSFPSSNTGATATIEVSNNSGVIVNTTSDGVLKYNGDTSVDWVNRQLLDSTEVSSVLWNDRQLRKGAIAVVNWDSCMLNDSSNNGSLSWENRTLYDSTNATVLTYGSGIEVSTTIESNEDIEITDFAKGVILKSPDGTRYRITVANGGTLNIAAA